MRCCSFVSTPLLSYVQEKSRDDVRSGRPRSFADRRGKIDGVPDERFLKGWRGLAGLRIGRGSNVGIRRAMMAGNKSGGRTRKTGIRQGQAGELRASVPGATSKGGVRQSENGPGLCRCREEPAQVAGPQGVCAHDGNSNVYKIPPRTTVSRLCRTTVHWMRTDPGEARIKASEICFSFSMPGFVSIFSPSGLCSRSTKPVMRHLLPGSSRAISLMEME